MKKIFKRLTFLAVPFMVLGCAGPTIGTSSNNPSTSSQQPSINSSSANPSSDKSSSANPSTSSSNGGDHTHSFGEWKTESLGTKINDARFKYSTIKYRECSVCHYEEIDSQQAILPEIRFDYNPSDPNANFATSARSTDTTRPKVNGKLRITNAGDKNTASAYPDVDMKVRGNQTAGFDKKGFQIKYGSY